MTGRVTVSLPALLENYALLCRHASGQVACVLKADAYGLGSLTVAPRLHQAGCPAFFVATVVEGVRLRGVVPRVPIYVLAGAVAGTTPDLVAHDLIPVLNTPAQLRAWASAGRPGAVHVDSGMYRLGLPLPGAAELISQATFEIPLLVSHLARADEVGHPMSADQNAAVQSLLRNLRVRRPELRLSLCNSAGLLQGMGPEDLGRAGVALYGGNPYVGKNNPMHAVVALEGCVLQVREVDAGTAVGYGSSHVAPAPTRLATVGVGYADGLPRLLTNTGRAWINGAYCPMVGRVSMDLVTLDIGTHRVEEGDLAELIGARVGVDEVAGYARTVAYELLTGLDAARRLERRYTEQMLPDDPGPARAVSG